MNIEEKIKKNYDLTFFNTFHIRAKARYFVAIKNQDELVKALNWAEEKKLRIFILGGGSNILPVSPAIRGLVVKISGERRSVKGNYISAWAGSGLTKLARLAKQEGLSGLEWAYGIPGQLGGALRGNAGAYGGNLSDLVSEVKVYDLSKRIFIRLNKRACVFGYRDSIFKTNGNLIAVNVKLRLKPGKKSRIGALMKKNLKHRGEIQPRFPSAGCVFKNLKYAELARQNKNLARELKAKGLVRKEKIGVGYLIDQLGLRGESRGGAKISQEHANFIVNSGNASAADVIKLVNLVKNKIKNKYKINLEEEIQYFGH